MSDTPRNRTGKRVPITTEGDDLTAFEIIILILSVFVLGLLFIQSAFRLSPDTNRLLNYIDFIICFVFIYDFFLRFIRARDKTAYLKWSWIDLISSIPMIDFFRIGRLLRIFRVLRILRAFRSTKLIAEYIFENRAGGILATVSLIAILLTFTSSIIILNFETGPNANIDTPADALLWSFALLTTVGLSDKFPVTTPGKMLAVTLMVTGVTLAGTFTGYVTSYFLEAARKKADREREADRTLLEKERQKSKGATGEEQH